MSNQTMIDLEVAAYLGRIAEPEPEPLRLLRQASRHVPNARWKLSPAGCNFLRMLIKLTGRRFGPAAAGPEPLVAA